jgi:asperthecin polyketide synthase
MLPHRSELHGAAVKLTCSLLCMVNRHHEINHLVLESVSSGALASGLSIGLFSAAALSTANTLADMVQTGVESLRLSFRLAVYVQDFSQKLESARPDGDRHSWTHVVTGMSEQTVGQELSKYNAQTGVSNLSKVFISAVDKAFIGITGPPSRFRAAFQFSESLRYANSFPLPVYDGVYHASHIYTADDVTAIVAGSSDELLASRKTNIPLVSSQHGTPFECTTARDLLRSICTELLTGTTYLDNVTAAIVQHIATDDRSSCTFHTFRTSLVTKSIIDGINTARPQHTPLEVCDMVSWAFGDYGPRQPASTSDAKLAIVGMACRMPGGANDPDRFWACLEKGYDASVRIQLDRFDLESTHFDQTGETGKSTQTEFGNFIDRPGTTSDERANSLINTYKVLTLATGHFDLGFFVMSPKEVEQTDPMMRLALMTAYEAMEMAGIVPGRTMSSKTSRISTYFDHGSDDCREFNDSQNDGTVLGGIRGYTSAVYAGCTALWAGDIDTVIAGGTNIITDVDNHANLCNTCFPSETGQSKAWDKGANGYCRAEGIGAVVIKRLEDAEADNDNILAVVLSAASNHSGDMRSITRPHAGAQEANYRQGM